MPVGKARSVSGTRGSTCALAVRIAARNASPVVPRGIRTSMEWSGLTRIGSSPLQIHIGFVSSHAKQLEHRKRSSGRVRVGAVRQCSDSRSPECTSSIMEPGVANREGKGAIKRAENEKSHSPELWESAWRRPQGGRRRRRLCHAARARAAFGEHAGAICALSGRC